MRPEPMVNVVKAPPRRKPLRRRRGGDAELTSRPGRPSLRHARRLGARRQQVKSTVLELAQRVPRERGSATTDHLNSARLAPAWKEGSDMNPIRLPPFSRLLRASCTDVFRIA